MINMKMETKQPLWFLKKYEKSGDYPVHVYKLENVRVEDLQRMFNEPSHNPMYDCYPVTESQAEWLQDFIKDKIDLQSYDYYIECEVNTWIP